MRSAYRLTVRASMLSVLWAICASGEETAPAASPAEPAVSQLVVMITAQVDGELRNGAGIIVGGNADRLYIVTANHLVRREHEAENVRVLFFSRPGEPAEVKLLNDYDRNLDLAVLGVDNPQKWGIDLKTLPFAALAESSTVKGGAEVYLLGYPSSQRWRMTVTPDHITRKIGDWVYFESNSIAPGFSGGALLNNQRELLGMIRADQPPDGEAVRIETIIEALDQWNYPVRLSSRQAKAAADIIGNWTTKVTYPWIRKASFEEQLTLKVDGYRLSGTASFCGVERGIIDGKISSGQITFTTQSKGEYQMFGGNLKVFEEKHFYKGRVAEAEIQFTMQTLGGPDATDQRRESPASDVPVEFTAKRVKHK